MGGKKNADGDYIVLNKSKGFDRLLSFLRNSLLGGGKKTEQLRGKESGGEQANNFE